MKKIICMILAVLLLLAVALPASAEFELVDTAELLSESQRAILQTRLSALSEDYGLDVAAVTVPTLHGRSAWGYANAFYDANYGQNGILLLIAEYEREWQVLAVGEGYRAMNDDAQVYLEEEILPLLREDRFYEAFVRYAEVCDEVLAMYQAGEPYEMPFSWGIALLISLGVGLSVGLIVVCVMKGKLKSVRPQTGAAAYTRNNSMKLTHQQEIFLYSNVTRVPRPKSNGSGGRSVGSSSRGGRGGSF